MTMSTADLENRDWQCDKAKISERCEYLLKNEKWTDCLFLVGPESKPFKAHKLILGMSSPVFDAMLYGQLAERDEPILIPDVQSAVFEKLLDYIYCDRLDVEDVDMTFDLCYAANKYWLLDLAKKCTKLISGKMSPSIACKSYELAKLIDEPELLQHTLSFICGKIDIILADPSIENIALDIWLDILDMDDIGDATECGLLNALDKWAVKECERKELEKTQENLRSVVGPALEKFRFLSLTAEECAKGLAHSQILLKEEIAAILINLLEKNKLYPMPSGFSSVITKRRRRVLEIYRLTWCSSFCKPVYHVCKSPCTWTMQFSVDREVCLHGFEITAYIEEHVTWNSFINATLLDKENKILASMSNNGPVSMLNKGATSINWNSVVTVRPRQFYKIEVAFCISEGNVLKFSLPPIDKSSTIAIRKENGVQFILKRRPQAEAVVQSIMFSLP